MAFLRTLFWVVLTMIVVIFSLRNWVSVTINLFGDLQADVKLPVLLLIAFLIGFVPLYAWHRAAIWRRTVATRPPGPGDSAPFVPVPGDGMSGESGILPARAD